MAGQGTLLHPDTSTASHGPPPCTSMEGNVDALDEGEDVTLVRQHFTWLRQQSNSNAIATACSRALAAIHDS